MREYKVVYVNTDRNYIRYDEQNISMDGQDQCRMQEAVLNHLANYGWRLVQTVHSREERFYLYLEREL